MYYFFFSPVFQSEWAVFWPEARRKAKMLKVEDRESNETTWFHLMYIKITLHVYITVVLH